ncbi:hypothetical protein NZK32_10720 [Cyanobium sp. FGCU-52]|nr:hypothetical protein [Cyanobium sp. FGCU52]
MVLANALDGLAGRNRSSADLTHVAWTPQKDQGSKFTSNLSLRAGRDPTVIISSPNKGFIRFVTKHTNYVRKGRHPIDQLDSSILPN